MPIPLIFLFFAIILLLALLWLLLRRVLKRLRPEDPSGSQESGLPLSWLLSSSLRQKPDDSVPSPILNFEPSEPLPDSMIKRPVAVLLFAGLFFAWAGQSLYRELLPSFERNFMLGMLLVGLSSFLLAGRLVTRRQLPARILQILSAVAGWLQISATGLMLLPIALLLALITSIAAGDILIARAPWIATVAWLLAIGCAVLGAWKRDEWLAPQSWSRIEWALSGILLLSAFALRVVWLDTVPSVLSGDEGSAGLVAVNFLKGEVDNLFTFGWFSFPSLYFAVQSIGIWLLGQTIAGARIMSVVAGSITVVVIFWFGRSLFNRLTGLIAAAYLAAAHYHIHISRIALNNVWDGMFTSLAMFGLWDGWKSGRRSSFILCGIALGLAQYFYVTIRVLPILILIWSLIALIADRRRFMQRLPDLFLTAFVALIVFAPLGILFARYPDEFNAPLSRVTIMGSWLEQTKIVTGSATWQIVAQQMKLTALGFTHQPLELLYNPGAPLLLAGPAALFLIGIVWALRHLDLRSWLLLLPIVAVVLLGGLSQSPPASQRFILCIGCVAILMARPLAQAVEWLSAVWPQQRTLILSSLAVVVMCLLFVDTKFYFVDAYSTYSWGGVNTATANDIAERLGNEPDQSQDVLFFGFPRMGYYSLSTIPYLVPDMDGVDIIETVNGAPAWELKDDTIFLFLPERVAELNHVKTAFPNGTYEEIYWPDGTLNFAMYKVIIPNN